MGQIFNLLDLSNNNNPEISNSHHLLSIYYINDIRLGDFTDWKIIYFLQDVGKGSSILPVFTVEHIEADKLRNIQLTTS